MSEAAAAALGMLSPAAGVAALAGVLGDLAAARSPHAAGKCRSTRSIRRISRHPRRSSNRHRDPQPVRRSIIARSFKALTSRMVVQSLDQSAMAPVKRPPIGPQTTVKQRHPSSSLVSCAVALAGCTTPNSEVQPEQQHAAQPKTRGSKISLKC